MINFYKRSLTLFFVLAFLTGLLVLICFRFLFIEARFLPQQDSDLAWSFYTLTDQNKGGKSTISVNSSNRIIDYNYFLTHDTFGPHVTSLLAFDELNNANHYENLTRYTFADFQIKCSPANILVLHMHSLDPKVTDPGDFSSYRIAEKRFDCDETWARVTVDLNQLYIPEWWLEAYQQELSDQQYWPDKVIAFSFGASLRGPSDTNAEVQILEFNLRAYNRYLLWASGILICLIWASYVYWLVKSYIKSVVSEMQEKYSASRSLVAYQQLTVEPHKDDEVGKLIRYIATNYANPDISLDFTSGTLGINRTKINEILKAELGFTFNTYLNRVRLSEAARILSNNASASIAEVAYLLGYKNVSYFNKLFKQEYGCTPKKFKNIYLDR